jgi:hypothetical protein
MHSSVKDAGGEMFAIDDAQLLPFHHVLAAGEDRLPVRLVYAAAHVIMGDNYAFSEHDEAELSEEIAAGIDWTATAELRVHLAAQGFGIAEAMDTAQRFSIGWPVARRLIQECGRLHMQHPFVAGAGADHLPEIKTKTELIEGVVFQGQFIQREGGIVMLLPLPWLTRNGCSEEDYVEVYAEIIRQLEGPIFVHWLSERFLPELEGYFPGSSFPRIMAFDPDKVRAAKLSLLDGNLEVRIRRALLKQSQVVLTGDDFHFTLLLRGGDPWSREATIPGSKGTTRIGNMEVPLGDFSHGLLGIFDAIAVPAGLALRFLARGDLERYLQLMLPCEKLSRWVFRHPTRHYKADLAFLSWLNGHQENPCLVLHEERNRKREDFLRTAQLAAAAGVLTNAELAAERIDELRHGV